MNSKTKAKKMAKDTEFINKHQEKVKFMKNNGTVEARDKVVTSKEEKEQKQLTMSRKFSAPVKKIPNVHSVGSVPAGAGDAQVVWRQLVQEKQRNKVLQVWLVTIPYYSNAGVYIRQIFVFVWFPPVGFDDLISLLHLKQQYFLNW